MALEVEVERGPHGRRQPRADRPGARQPRRQRHQIFGRRRRSRTCEVSRARRSASGGGRARGRRQRARASPRGRPRSASPKRFVRLEESRSEPGSGLGLSLVKAVAQLHGGNLELADNDPGLRVIMMLPEATSRPERPKRSRPRRSRRRQRLPIGSRRPLRSNACARRRCARRAAHAASRSPKRRPQARAAAACRAARRSRRASRLPRPASSRLAVSLRDAARRGLPLLDDLIDSRRKRGSPRSARDLAAAPRPADDAKPSRCARCAAQGGGGICSSRWPTSPACGRCDRDDGAALTRLADAALTAAVDFLLREATARASWRCPIRAIAGAAAGCIVLGMGKFGAGELNYSCDIDLIVFFDPRAHPRSRRASSRRASSCG